MSVTLTQEIGTWSNWLKLRIVYTSDDYSIRNNNYTNCTAKIQYYCLNVSGESALNDQSGKSYIKMDSGTRKYFKKSVTKSYDDTWHDFCYPLTAVTKSCNTDGSLTVKVYYYIAGISSSGSVTFNLASQNRYMQCYNLTGSWKMGTQGNLRIYPAKSNHVYSVDLKYNEEDWTQIIPSIAGSSTYIDVPYTIPANATTYSKILPSKTYAKISFRIHQWIGATDFYQVEINDLYLFVDDEAKLLPTITSVTSYSNDTDESYYYHLGYGTTSNHFVPYLCDKKIVLNASPAREGHSITGFRFKIGSWQSEWIAPSGTNTLTTSFNNVSLWSGIDSMKDKVNTNVVYAFAKDDEDRISGANVITYTKDLDYILPTAFYKNSTVTYNSNDTVTYNLYFGFKGTGWQWEDDPTSTTMNNMFYYTLKEGSTTITSGSVKLTGADQQLHLIVQNQTISSHTYTLEFYDSWKQVAINAGACTGNFTVNTPALSAKPVLSMYHSSTGGDMIETNAFFKSSGNANMNYTKFLQGVDVDGILAVKGTGSTSKLTVNSSGITLADTLNSSSSISATGNIASSGNIGGATFNNMVMAQTIAETGTTTKNFIWHKYQSATSYINSQGSIIWRWKKFSDDSYICFGDMTYTNNYPTSSVSPFYVSDFFYVELPFNFSTYLSVQPAVKAENLFSFLDVTSDHGNSATYGSYSVTNAIKIREFFLTQQVSQSKTLSFILYGK